MTNANLILLTYAAYLGLSVALTVWVAQTLHRSGRLFLVRAFHDDEAMADSTNHLLVVGFYLVNLGWIAVALRFGVDVTDAAGVVETLGVKLGGVMLILGVLHFLNLLGFNRLRLRAEEEKRLRDTRWPAATGTPPPPPAATGATPR